MHFHQVQECNDGCKCTKCNENEALAIFFFTAEERCRTQGQMLVKGERVVSLNTENDGLPIQMRWVNFLIEQMEKDTNRNTHCV